MAALGNWMIDPSGTCRCMPPEPANLFSFAFFMFPACYQRLELLRVSCGDTLCRSKSEVNVSWDGVLPMGWAVIIPLREDNYFVHFCHPSASRYLKAATDQVTNPAM